MPTPGRSALAGLLLVVAALMLDARPLAAHPGGHGPIDYEQALESGAMVVEEMVEGKYVDASWHGMRPISAQRMIRNQENVWMVTVRNPDAPDPAKRMLYIFFDEFGDYLAANHTGR